MTPEYIIGIDLHGTLLDKQWEIKDEVKPDLLDSLEKVGGFCRVYVCSGNDLTFIEKYVPAEVREHFDGYVLETGCVVSDGESEEVIVEPDLVDIIKELEEKLKSGSYDLLKYFARRLTSISMFTRDEMGGTEPADFHPEVTELVKAFGYEGKVLVTHSNVAVDIIPRGYNKFSGIMHVAQGLKTIGVADSLNDIHLIADGDYAFVPSNAAPRLLKEMGASGKKIVPIGGDTELSKNVIYQSRFAETVGVIDILRFIGSRMG